MYINIDTKEKNMSKRTIIHIADAHISKAYSSQTSEMCLYYKKQGCQKIGLFMYQEITKWILTKLIMILQLGLLIES